MIRQTLAIFGAATMLGATSLAVANDTQASTATPAPSGETQAQQLDVRSNEAERKPEGGTQEPSNQ